MNLQEFKMMDMEGRLRATFATVEATAYEQLCLWRENASRSSDVVGKVKWEQVLDGWLPTIGHMTKKAHPVVISLHWCIIEDRPVLFWHPTSQIVDHRLIDEWLKRMVPQAFLDQPNLVQGAGNFHAVIHAIGRANKQS